MGQRWNSLGVAVATCALLVLMRGGARAEIATSPYVSAQDLVDAIVGSGLTVVPGSSRFTGDPIAVGRFTGGGSSGIGFESGILLTTGSRLNAQGLNLSDGLGTNNGGPNADPDLQALAGGGVFDVAALEFDFMSTSSNLEFNFVFASDEYNEFVGSGFNDVFGLLVDGTNVALIPGTNTPVSIGTVNGGTNLDPATASNPAHFNNNDLTNGGPFFNFAYDGFTNVFTATVNGLQPGTHSVKFVIGDVGDATVDSAVFIQSGTFAAPRVIPEPGSAWGLGLCLLIAGGVWWWRSRRGSRRAVQVVGG